MGGDDRPGLRAVSDVPSEEPAPQAPQERSAEGRRGRRGERPGRGRAGRQRGASRGWLTILLVLALLVSSLGYLFEGQRARELETRLTALQVELQDAQQDLRAQEERMQVVRGHVDDLAGRFQLLQQAIAVDAE